MTEVQQPEIPPSPKLSLRLRVLFFFGDPLIAVCLLLVSILVAIAGTAAGKSELVLSGIVLALSAIGFLFLVVLMSLETLNGWAAQILRNVAALHDEEMQKLEVVRRSPSSLKLGSRGLWPSGCGGRPEQEYSPPQRGIHRGYRCAPGKRSS
jgi:hypothetical protein